MKTFSKRTFFICACALLASGTIHCDEQIKDKPIKVDEDTQTYLDNKKELADLVATIEKTQKDVKKEEVVDLENNLKNLISKCLNASRDSHEQYECKRYKVIGAKLIQEIKDQFAKQDN